MNRLALIIALSIGASMPAVAACPPPVAGDTAAAIAANQQRLVCLQRELAAEGQQYRYKVEIEGLDRSIQDLQMQRRFDALNLPKPTMPGF